MASTSLSRYFDKYVIYIMTVVLIFNNNLLPLLIIITGNQLVFESVSFSIKKLDYMFCNKNQNIENVQYMTYHAIV